MRNTCFCTAPALHAPPCRPPPLAGRALRLQHVPAGCLTFSVLSRRSSRGARLRRRTFSLLSPLTFLLSVLCSALFSLCSPLSSPLFSLSSCPRWTPSSIPRVLSNCLLALLSPCPSPLSALPLSLLSVFSLLSPAPRSSRNCVCCSSCLSARQISLRKTT